MRSEGTDQAGLGRSLDFILSEMACDRSLPVSLGISPSLHAIHLYFHVFCALGCSLVTEAYLFQPLGWLEVLGS